MSKLIVDIKDGKVVPISELSDMDIKAIEVALHHQWHKTTDDDGKAISCSQEMADTTYKMMSLFEKLRKNDKGETVPETCKKCGGKIVVALKGEPVFICKDCGEYYGTLPFKR